MIISAKYAKNHFQQNRYSVFEGHVMRKECLSTKIFRLHSNSEVVWGLVRWTPTRRAGIDALLGLAFLSAHYTEIAVAILLKMIFRVFSFGCTSITRTYAGLIRK